jgi:plastocyanin
MKARLGGRQGAAALALAAWLLVPGPSVVAQGSSTSINMTADSFSRTEVHIAPGQSVVWNNPGADTHTVTTDDGTTFDSGDVGTGGQFSYEFDAPGTYPYFCQYHGGPGGQGMSGVIIVDG